MVHPTPVIFDVCLSGNVQDKVISATESVDCGASKNRISPLRVADTTDISDALQRMMTGLVNTGLNTAGSFTQPPMRRMRICFTNGFFSVFFSVSFSFFFVFSVRQKIPDNRSRERLNRFS